MTSEKKHITDKELEMVCPGPEHADNRKVWYTKTNTEGGRRGWDGRVSLAARRRSRR